MYILLFIVPLYLTYRDQVANNNMKAISCCCSKKTLATNNNQAKISKKDASFINTMSWNTILSILATSSTVCLQILLIIFQKYWWLLSCDFAINSICSFLMLGANRKFALQLICCFRISHNESTKAANILDTHNTSGGGKS